MPTFAVHAACACQRVACVPKSSGFCGTTGSPGFTDVLCSRLDFPPDCLPARAPGPLTRVFWRTLMLLPL